MKFTVATIVKNEENSIAKYVENYKPYVDEIIIVDNGSSDNTAAIAKELGCKVLFSDKSFDLARNDYLQNALGDWIISMDLDEEVLPNDIEILKKELGNVSENTYAIILPSFQYFGNGKWATWYMPRIIRKNPNVKFSAAIHGSVTDSVEKNGGIFGYIYTPIHHFDGVQGINRNLEKRKRNIKYLTEEYKMNPLRIKVPMSLATEYQSIGDSLLAFKYGKEACRLDIDGTERARLRLAQIYIEAAEYQLALKNLEEQILLLEKAIKESECRAISFIKHIDICSSAMARCYFLQGKLNVAEDIYLSNIKRNPELPHNYLNLYLLKPNDYTSFLDKAIQLNPNISDSRIHVMEKDFNMYHEATSILPIEYSV